MDESKLKAAAETLAGKQVDDGTNRARLVAHCVLTEPAI
jgi:hypothetical protein